VTRSSDAELMEASLVDAGRFGEIFDRLTITPTR